MNRIETKSDVRDVQQIAALVWDILTGDDRTGDLRTKAELIVSYAEGLSRPVPAKKVTPEEMFEFVAMGMQMGLHDSQLERFRSILKRRQAVIQAEKAATLQVGDEIKLGNISPKMLSGASATVTGFDGDLIVVRLHGYYSHKWNQNTKVRVTRNHLA